MSIWDHLFDSEFRQRSDINQTSQTASTASASVVVLRRDLAATQKKLERLELVCEALVRYLEVREIMKPEELAVMIQRLDLADGREDGRIGPDRVAQAPKCPFCKQPFNPQRTECIYCGKGVSQADLELTDQIKRPRREPKPKPQKPTPYVRCAKCVKRILKDKAHFCEEGLVCEACSQQ